MERQRSVYIKFATTFTAVAVLLVFNKYVLRHSIEDRVYRMAAFFSKHSYGDTAGNYAIGIETGDQALQRENDVLRKQLGVASRKSQNPVLAKIIFIQRNAMVSMVVIDRGTEDGIHPGMTVVSAGNILAGSVITVFSRTAWVILADDPRFTASIRINNSALLAELKGGLSNRVSVNLVSHTENVALDATVSTSGLDAFAAGIAIARITSVENGKNLFKDIRGTLLFDVSESPLLFIIP